MNRQALLIGLCATMLSACISEDRVVIPDTTGQVVDWASGALVQGAEVTAPAAPTSVTTDLNGVFTLSVFKQRDSRVLLPASGVFIDQAELVARTGEARAYGAVYFLTLSEDAEDEVALFLMPEDADHDTSALPEGCVANDRETYALQILAAPPAPAVRQWLTARPGRADNFAAGLRATLVRGLADRCGLGLDVQMDWIEQIDALPADAG